MDQRALLCHRWRQWRRTLAQIDLCQGDTASQQQTGKDQGSAK
jgi:hypothetical protein